MDFSWIWPWFESQLSTSEIGWLRPPKMLMTSRRRIVAEISSELKNRTGGNLLAPHLQIMGSNPTTYACSFLFHCCTFLIKLFLWWSSSTCRFEFSLLIQSTMNKYCLSLLSNSNWRNFVVSNAEPRGHWLSAGQILFLFRILKYCFARYRFLYKQGVTFTQAW